MNAFKILKTQKYKKIDDKFIQWEKNFKWYQSDRKGTEENNNDERNRKKTSNLSNAQQVWMTTWTDDENLPLEFFLPFILIYLKIIRKIQAGPGKKYQVSAIEQLIVLKNKINKMLLKICET